MKKVALWCKINFKSMLKAWVRFARSTIGRACFLCCTGNFSEKGTGDMRKNKKPQWEEVFLKKGKHAVAVALMTILMRDFREEACGRSR